MRIFLNKVVLCMLGWTDRLHLMTLHGPTVTCSFNPPSCMEAASRPEPLQTQKIGRAHV